MKRAVSGQNLFLLFALSLGHMLMHCFQQGWYIVMPSMKETFGLSDIQYGAIESTRSAANAALLVPAGVVADILRKQWVIATAGGLVGLGAAYVVLGLAPNYGVGLALVAVCAGLFIYSVSILAQAAAMDATPPGTGGATIALLMGSAALFQIPSPTIAGWLSESYGTQSVFLYSGALVLVSALVLLFLPRKDLKAAGEKGG